MGKIKYSIKDVKEYVKENSNCELLSTEYVNFNNLLEFKCFCGKMFTKSFNKFINTKKKCCSKCMTILNEKRHSFEYVKRYVESRNDCILLSKEYINVTEELEIKCQCGKTFHTSFFVFRNGKHHCDDCGIEHSKNLRKTPYEEVKEYIDNNTKFTLLSANYINAHSHLKLQCECGQIEERTIGVIKSRNIKWCKVCTKREQRETVFFDNITKLLRKFNLEFICFVDNEEVRTARNTKFIVKCINNHFMEKTIGTLKHKDNKRQCKKCYGLDNMGSNNHVFKGTKTIYQFCRGILDDWKMKSMMANNFKCILTGGADIEVHHLFSYHKIIDLLVEDLNIPLYDEINLYSNEQLIIIQNKCLQLHEYYGLGICLRKDIHKLFHKIYGRYNNTPEQFEKFKINYINNKYSELLEEGNTA